MPARRREVNVVREGSTTAGGHQLWCHTPAANTKAPQEMEEPLYYWDPSIAPSGMRSYTADRPRSGRVTSSWERSPVANLSRWF